jgi:homoserine kinase type II
MNRHWRATIDGRALVLRCYSSLRTARSVAWEQQLVAFAASKGWPVAPHVASTAGDHLLEHCGRLWSAHPLLQGTPPEASSPPLRHIAGRLLARLHRDLRTFDDHGQRPGFGKTWELDTLVEPAGAGSFNALLALFARDYPDLASRIRRERYRNLRDLSRLRYPDLPDHPIHGDFQPSNLLFTDGQLTGLLDFDQSRRDALICDIAPLLMPFQPLDPPLARAFLEGYQSVRPLSDTEWDLLPALVRAALLWWLAFLLTRWHLHGDEQDIQGIARTVNQRFPAFDAAEPGLRVLRAAPGLRP